MAKLLDHPVGMNTGDSARIPGSHVGQEHPVPYKGKASFKSAGDAVIPYRSLREFRL